MEETIAAIATPRGIGSVSVIRISGDRAIEVASHIFAPTHGGHLAEVPGYTARHGRLVADAVVVDEAVALVFRAPKSYTGENVVELSCHGGIDVTRRVLRAVLDAGAQPAQPGEFTKRAFLNGKMDLAQAESVMQLISAQGKSAADAALSALEGRLSGEIAAVREKLVELSAHLAAFADYPEEEIPALSGTQIQKALQVVCFTLEQLLGSFESGKIIREGVDTAIVGRPNVGKSTLMNLLSGTQRSIVAEIAGTTRDVVEETVRLGEITLRLADTAGIRETEDLIEQIGVSRARERMSSAQLVLAVFDKSEPLNAEDVRLLEACCGRLAVAVVNKSDLPPLLDVAAIREKIPACVEISAQDSRSAGVLAAAVAAVLGTSDFDPDAPLLISDRQRNCCRRAYDAAYEAKSGVEQGVTLDAITVCVEDAVRALLELTGECATDTVVDEIFSKFCVGK